MSNERFIKFIDSEKSDYLLEYHPNAFLLLALIAKRARRTRGSPDGREIGEAHIGDWEACGISERQYRTAKDILCKLNFIRIIETNRTRKKSTTGATTGGTKVKLLNSSIWDINPEPGDDRIDDRATTDRRLTDDEQEGKECKERKKELQNIAQTAPPPRQKVDAISFSFEARSFLGIIDVDLSSWQELYPAVALDSELKKMSEWCLSNPQKARSKKLWRRFITNWLQRANEHAINTKAYQTRQEVSLNRSTKDKHGNPIRSYAEEKGLF